MNQSNLSMFSAIGSEFSIKPNDTGYTIVKTTLVTKSMQPHWFFILSEIEHYITALRNSGVQIPKVYRLEGSPEKLIFECEFCGDNIVQHVQKSSPDLFINHPTLLDQLLDVVLRCQTNGLYLDPHIKNLVMNQDKVSYVDFSPPLTKPYMDLKLSLTNAAEQNDLEHFFYCMSPERLGYHFACDLVKVDARFMNIMPQIYDRLKTRHMIKSDYHTFLQQMDQIKTIEATREKRGIALL